MITLELIAHSNTTYSEPEYLDLDIASHVHKRIERFVYQRNIPQSSVPIAYLENKALDVRDNLRFSDKSWTVPANSRKLLSERAPTTFSRSTAISSQYKDVLITNKTFINKFGKKRPLFYKHKLPEGTKEVKLVVTTRGNRVEETEGYLVDIEAGFVFTNHKNYFNTDTGAYKLYYLICSVEDGESVEQLLNVVPVASEATWEDIDLDTGKVVDTYPLYTRERSGS